MKIKTIEDYMIEFDNGYKLTFEHRQDCCEKVYADFKHLLAYQQIKEFDFEENIEDFIKLAKGHGFFIICRAPDDIFYHYCAAKIFVPCYNIQNGYYSNDLTLIITKKNKKEIKIDLTEMTADYYNE